MILRALKYSAIAGIGFWLLLNLLVMVITGGHGDPTDVHKPSLSLQLLGLLISITISVLLFACVGLISVGILKTVQFVKRTLGFS
jgi:hypothetical protein